jgi:hypothetical protein
MIMDVKPSEPAASVPVAVPLRNGGTVAIHGQINEAMGARGGHGSSAR